MRSTLLRTADTVVIGVALGTQGDNAFIPLFLAILFHQMFEGLGFGARIALIPGHGLRKIVLATLYALTTPLGVAIGLGVHQGFNPNTPGFLIAVGVLDAVRCVCAIGRAS